LKMFAGICGHGLTIPQAEDSIGLAEYVTKDVDMFVAWCNAVQSESPVLQREVKAAAVPMLTSMKNVVSFLIENKLQKAPSTQMVGEVMVGNEQLKKLSKSEAQGVQKELLRCAAAVKTVLSDLNDMLQNSAARGMAAMGLSEDEEARDKEEATMDDLMNMDMELSPEETKVAEACAGMVEACMALLKAAVRIIAAKAKEGDGSAQESLPYEAVAQSAEVFTRAAEDLGALSCIDQSQCRSTGEQMASAMDKACLALGQVAAAKLEEAVSEHVANAKQAVETAKSKVPVL